MIISKEIKLETKGDCDIINITPEVEQKLAEVDMICGIVTIFATGSTAGLTTMEFEPGLISDFKKM